MRIAVISDDQATVSQHFGRAPLYVIVTVEAGKVVGRETRPKAGHHTFAPTEHRLAPGERHGYDAGSEAKHRTMAETIADCQVLVAGGMGLGAYESMKGNNIEPIVTNVRGIDEAVRLYLDGKLVNLMERLH